MKLSLSNEHSSISVALILLQVEYFLFVVDMRISAIPTRLINDGLTCLLTFEMRTSTAPVGVGIEKGSLLENSWNFSVFQSHERQPSFAFYNRGK